MHRPGDDDLRDAFGGQQRILPTERQEDARGQRQEDFLPTWWRPPYSTQRLQFLEGLRFQFPMVH